MLHLEPVELEPLKYKLFPQDSGYYLKTDLCGVLKHLVKIRWNL